MPFPGHPAADPLTATLSLSVAYGAARNRVNGGRRDRYALGGGRAAERSRLNGNGSIRSGDRSKVD